jgi:taurine--2-oxoglutarate transaminase
VEAIKKHTIFSWGATEPSADSALSIAKGDGVFFTDLNGRRYLDFNSQAMCSNLGHTVPQDVIDEIQAQLHTIAYSYPCATITPIKAQLAALLADLMPSKELGHFYFTCGGAESNETAMRMARLMTGRHKILARYRSYHGGSLGAMALTGDPRRFYSEPGVTGVVHFMDPFPYSFSWGSSEDEITQKSLQQLREVIMYEGPKNIAAIFLESVTGTNGVLLPPKGYLEGIRKMCDEHGILMVCDEVMNGFGRTGKMFGFMHTSPMIIPDIITMAKGINGAFVPLGAVACRDHVAQYFMKNPVGIGSTYNSHPIGLASAYAVLKYMLKARVLDNVSKLAPIMKTLQKDLAARHPSIKSTRSIGLFGMIDLQKNRNGDPFVTYNGPAHPAIAKFKNEMMQNGLFTLIRWSGFFTNPPLTITEEELKSGFAILDKSLLVLDKEFDK